MTSQPRLRIKTTPRDVTDAIAEAVSRLNARVARADRRAPRGDCRRTWLAVGGSSLRARIAMFDCAFRLPFLAFQSRLQRSHARRALLAFAHSISSTSLDRRRHRLRYPGEWTDARVLWCFFLPSILEAGAIGVPRRDSSPNAPAPRCARRRTGRPGTPPVTMWFQGSRAGGPGENIPVDGLNRREHPLNHAPVRRVASGEKGRGRGLRRAINGRGALDIETREYARPTLARSSPSSSAPCAACAQPDVVDASHDLHTDCSDTGSPLFVIPPARTEYWAWFIAPCPAVSRAPGLGSRPVSIVSGLAAAPAMESSSRRRASRKRRRGRCGFRQDRTSAKKAHVQRSPR